MKKATPSLQLAIPAPLAAFLVGSRGRRMILLLVTANMFGHEGKVRFIPFG